jgi:hypothetical protein
MKRHRESDPEGLLPDVIITKEGDEHEGHEWEPSETLHDNSIEHTRWAYCMTCEKSFMIESWTIA